MLFMRYCHNISAITYLHIVIHGATHLPEDGGGSEYAEIYQYPQYGEHKTGNGEYVYEAVGALLIQ